MMTRMHRGAVAALLACLLGVAGCGSEEEEKRKPWDGRFTPLEEYGDWEDTGRHASCRALAERYGPCGTSLASFDLSGCQRDTLGQLSRKGIYRAKLRYEIPGGEENTPYIASGGGSLRFAEDGTPSLVQGYPTRANEAQLAAETGRFTGYAVEQTEAGPVTTTYTLVGCAAPSPGVLTGCFSFCTGESQGYVGTFRAERMSWARAERESAGGLRALSESRVELGDPVDVYVAKNHAYVVSINGKGREGGLTIFDVTDRSHPIFKGSISIPGDSYWNGVWAKGDALYVASGTSGVIVFDISNPGQPAFLRSLPGGAALNVHTVLVDGDRLYAMSPSPNGETLIFDVSTPTQPVLLGRMAHATRVSYPHDAFAFGDRLYVSHGNDGYQVFDVRDPANSRHLGGYTFPNAFSHHSAVGVIGGHTLAFEGGERMGAHLRVLKVDDPAHIVKIGEFKLRDVASIHNILLVGTRLYIAWYHEGVRVLDVSDPTQPRQVAYYNTFRDTDPDNDTGLYEGAIGIRVPGDGHVYVVDQTRGLLVFKEP
ncbi:LVIVD repeat-containing protein [Pyxidicoccus xibeiensis]|uniref:LVIVD repeat-containing protein n=1 Tax=Pyxidicoccus xibeiensis TaxID=2906759 RepID=UPI0020A80B94|nr:hypothetical protein [Pyxidicoccus xibeiensis]MCP3137290.1 hypothetical protein [Pyxidicoccus xibeiensis]